MISRRTGILALMAYASAFLGQRRTDAQAPRTGPVDPTPAELQRARGGGPRGTMQPQRGPVWSQPTSITIALGSTAYSQINFTHEGEKVTFTGKELFDALKSGR